MVFIYAEDENYWILMLLDDGVRLQWCGSGVIGTDFFISGPN